MIEQPYLVPLAVYIQSSQDNLKTGHGFPMVLYIVMFSRTEGNSASAMKGKKGFGQGHVMKVSKLGKVKAKVGIQNNINITDSKL